MAMRIKFVIQDFWIGLYWKSESFYLGGRVTNLPISVFGVEKHRVTTWYLCLLPCLPIIFTTTKITRSKPVKGVNL